MSDLSDLQEAIDEIRRWQGVPLPTEEEEQEEQEEQKTGKWEHIPYTGIYECPKCGYRVNLSDGGIYNFCSACGEKMEGEG